MKVILVIVIAVCAVLLLGFLFFVDKGDNVVNNQDAEYNSGALEEQTIEENEIINEAIEDVGTAEISMGFALQGLGVNIGQWDKTRNLAGDLIFTKKLLFEDENILNDWVFVEFGAEGQLKREPSSRNIEYWFHVPLRTDVRAPVGGRVDVVFFEHTNDWGVNFYPEGSDFIVSFEHVVNLKVQNGDIVKAGDIVGDAAPRKTFNNEVAMVELAVWKGGQGVTKYCPFDYLDDSLKPIYEQKIKRLASDWEEYIGKDVYADEKWVSPGCLIEYIKEI
ncbi:MAG: hypothetical protein AABW79_03995 [Nanoarchaeota archaeon]